MSIKRQHKSGTMTQHLKHNIFQTFGEFPSLMSEELLIKLKRRQPTFNKLLWLKSHATENLRSHLFEGVNQNVVNFLHGGVFLKQ